MLLFYNDLDNMDKNLLLTAIRASLEAGSEIMSVYTDPNADFEIEKKADNSPLTIADRKSHMVIAARLALDGTKEFIKRNGEFTVNIAYVKNGKPEAGVIYIPVKEELYFADSQYGAYKIEHITQLDSDETVDSLIGKAHRLPYQEEAQRSSFIIVASRSHLTPETEAYIEEMKQKHQEVETVSKGSSLKLCLIAEGKADVYPRFAPTMEWDTAAGHAIIRAMGKEVYQAGTQHPLEYNKEDLLNPWFIAE